MIVTYVVLPLLATWAFLRFCGVLYRERAAVVLAGVAFTFSGVGLWHSAWLYFQEAFTFFLLLDAGVRVLEEPTPRHLAWLALAGLVQLASFNYWTVYNAPFALILAGTYAACRPGRMGRLRDAVGRLLRRRTRWTVAVVGLAAVTAGLWCVLLGSVAFEQSSALVRRVGDYDIDKAAERIRDLSSFVPRLFDPRVPRASADPQLSMMHDARYVGATLVPLLVAVAAT